jgi:hypothetical protein
MPIEILANVRTALQPVAPTFIRGTFLITGDNATQLPDDCILIDPITSPVVNDFDDEYAIVLLQITAWSRSLRTAGNNAAAVDAVMKALGWRLEAFRLAPTDDEFKGVQADYRRLF